MLGITLAIFGTLMALVQAFLTAPAVKYFGEYRLTLMGLISAVVGSIGFAAAPQFAFVAVALVLYAPEGFVQPMLSALISKLVPDDAQGELQGGLASIMSISMLLGTLFFSQEFGYFMSEKAWFTSPNVAMYSSAVISALAAILFVSSTRQKRVRS